jgi:hypothetical protein
MQAGAITSTGATITWTTSKASDSQVDYGPTTAYGQSSTLNATLVTSHSQGLSGLTPATLYHYRVKSRDAVGNLATSVDSTFTTASGTTGAPTVTSTVPASGSTGVLLTSTVQATFSQAMNATTITTATITLVPQGSSTPVAATVSYTPANLTATLTPTASLVPGQVYTATVKSGSTGVKDTNGTAVAADQVWNFTARTGPPAGNLFVSDLTWTSMTNGWGPVEKDMSNGENLAGDGRTLSIRGITFTKGLGAHAASEVDYNLGGGCTTFTATVGIDDEVAPNGSVVFQVWGDGTKLFDSALVTGTMAGKAATADLTGKSVL